MKGNRKKIVYLKKEDLGISKRIKKSSGILIIFVVLLSSLVLAYAPQAFNVVGRLTDSSGNNLQGTYGMNFSIYNTPTGTNSLWSLNTSVTTDSSGVYSVRLTNINLNFSEQYYLGIKVGNDSEMTPRINMSSSGWAFRARNVSVSGVEFVSNVELNSKNITTTGTGFFSYLGSLTSRITSFFVQDANFNGTVNITGNFIVNNSNLFVNVSSGKVGIGTSTPFSLFEVGKASGTNEVNLSGVVYVNSTSGNVGIGTTSPTDKLNIVGNVNVTSNLTLSSAKMYVDGAGDLVFIV